MNAPKGVKHAIAIGANEVLMEWLPSIISDPDEVIDGTDLGATYQHVLDDATFEPAVLARMLGDLAPWDRGGDSSASHFENVLLAAGLDFARGLIALAYALDRVPPAVEPYRAELAPLVALLKQAMTDGDFSEETADLQAIIFG